MILVLSINTAKAQLSGQAKIDSLLKELPNMEEDTNGVNLLFHLTNEYTYINPENAIKYGLKGIKISKNIGWDIGTGNLLNSVGVGFQNQSNFTKATEYFLKALKINNKLKNKLNIAKNLGNIGIIYSHQSNHSKAIEYFLKALKINEELKYNSGIASNLSAIGNIFYLQSELDKALEYYQKSLKIYKKLNFKIGIATITNNIANIYASQEKYTKAVEYFKEARIVYEELGNINGVATIQGNIGAIYNLQSDFINAHIYYQKSLLNFEKMMNKSGEANAHAKIGYLFLNLVNDTIINKSENKTQLILDKETNLNKAIEHINKSNAITKKIGEILQTSHILNLLSDAYKLKGDYKKAFETYKEYKTLKDSIFSTENQTKIANLEAKRENELKEKEIVILRKEKENEKLQRYAMFGGIAGLGIIIGLILIQRRKSEKLLLNVLPAKIAKRLKAKEHPIADHFDDASIIFIDLVGFTKMSSSANPKEIVGLLNDIFTSFDKLADKHGLEKIKTIGDAYMAVAGIPEIQTDHAKRTALMALDIKHEMKDFKTSDGTVIKFRIGIDCGAVVAGVIGEKKFIYDLWSDAVNTASRMESTGEKGQIQITENFKEELEKYDGDWNFTFRGEFEIKGKGLMKTYFLEENNLGEL